MKVFLYYGIARLFNVLFTIIVTKVFTTYLNLDEFGKLDLYLTIIPLGSSLIGFGLPSALNRELNLYNRSLKDLFLLIYVYILKIIIVLFFLSIINIIFEFISLNTFLLIELSILVFIFNDYLIGLLRGLGKAKIYLKGNFIQGIIYVILLILFRKELNIDLILFLYSFSLLSSLIYYIFIFKNYLFGGKLKKEIYRSVFYFGMPLMFSGIASFIFNSSDKYILAFYSSLEEVAVYSIGYKIASVLSVFIGIIQMGWPKYMYKIYKKYEYKYLYDLIGRIYLFILMMISVFIILLDKFLLHIFANDNYISGLKIVPIVLAGLVLYGMHFITSNGINIKGKSFIIPLSLLLGAIVNIILNFIFIPKYGYIAAAWTTFIAMILIFLLVFYFSNKILFVNYKIIRILISYIFFLILIFSFKNYLLILVIFNIFILFSRKDIQYLLAKWK